MAYPSPGTYPSASLYPGGPGGVYGFPAAKVADRVLRPANASGLGHADTWVGASPYGDSSPRLGILSPGTIYPPSATGTDYTVEAVQPPVDAWWTCTTHTGGHELNLLQTTGAAFDGYAVIINSTGATLQLAKYVAGAQTTLQTVTLPATFAGGDSYGIRVVDGRVEGWWRDASGTDQWLLVASADDTTFGGPFRLALWSGVTGNRFARVGFGRSVHGRVWPSVLIDWDAYSSGSALILGSGTIGSGVLGGYLALQPGFVHAESDVTRHVQNLSIQRGRADTNTPAYSGRLDLQLKDPDGRYTPGAFVSPPNIALDVMLGVRVIAVHQGEDYNLFTGYTTRARQAYRGGSAASGATRTTYISADDGSAYLAGAKVGDAFGSGTVTYSGQKACELVDLWLRQVNVPWRNCGTVADTTGLSWTSYENETVQGAPDPNAPTAMSLIQNLLVADQGAFYFNAGGTAEYLPRTYRYPGTAVPIGTITSVVEGLEPTIDIGDLATRAIINAGGTVNSEQAWTFPYTSPTDRYGYRDVSLSSDFIKDTSHLIELAYFALDTNTAYSGSRKAQLPVERSIADTTLALSCELGRKVVVSVPIVVNYNGTPASTAMPTVSGWVDGLEHQWNPGEPLRTTVTLGYDSGVSLDVT